MAQLHRHTRDPKYFNILRVLDEFARDNGGHTNFAGTGVLASCTAKQLTTLRQQGLSIDGRL